MFRLITPLSNLRGDLAVVKSDVSVRLSNREGLDERNINFPRLTELAETYMLKLLN